MRIGFGKDIHKTIIGENLVLGGILIPCDFGLEAHSDGDVVIHSLVDAILGALNDGDIGTHFPDNDDKYYKISSLYFLKYVENKLSSAGYFIENIDIHITCEKPKLRPYIDMMKEKIAHTLKIDKEKVSIKAGTNEGIGEIGKGYAIESTAVVLINK